MITIVLHCKAKLTGQVYPHRSPIRLPNKLLVTMLNTVKIVRGAPIEHEVRLTVSATIRSERFQDDLLK